MMHNQASMSMFLIFHLSCYESNYSQEEIFLSNGVKIIKTTALKIAAFLLVPILKVKDQQILNFKTSGSLKLLSTMKIFEFFYCQIPHL